MNRYLDQFFDQTTLDEMSLLLDETLLDKTSLDKT
jgi:hypothetical protein